VDPMPACPHSGPLPVRGDSPAGTTCPDLARRDSLGRQDRTGTARPPLTGSDFSSVSYPVFVGGPVGQSTARWDGRDAEVEDPASVISQHQEYIEDLEAHSRNSEEVYRY
jgi:hypothetical protein